MEVGNLYLLYTFTGRTVVQWVASQIQGPQLGPELRLLSVWGFVYVYAGFLHVLQFTPKPLKHAGKCESVYDGLVSGPRSIPTSHPVFMGLGLTITLTRIKRFLRMNEWIN